MSFPLKLIRFAFILLFVLVPLIFLPSTTELFEFNKIIITYLVTVLTGAAWAAEMVINRKFIFKKTPLDLPILIFLLSNLISLSLSIDVRTSLLGYYSRFNGGLASLYCYSLLYWAYVTFMDKKSTLITIRFSLLACFMVSVYGILEHFGIDAHLWVQDVQNRVFSTLGQPNWLAAYITTLIFIPVSMFLKFQINSKGQNLNVNNYLVLGYWLLFIVFVLCLFYTKSRSGLLAFGVSSAVFWIMLIINNLKFKNSLKISNLKLKIILFAGIILALSIVIPNPLRDYLIKPSETKIVTSQGTILEAGGTDSEDIRKIVWTGAVRIWQASIKNLLIGTGPETFTYSYYQYRPIEHNYTSEWDLLYNKAHNEFLNYLSTTGIIGLLSYLFLQSVMFWILLKSINHSPLAISLFVGWLTIPVTNFWGFSVVITQLFLFFAPRF